MTSIPDNQPVRGSGGGGSQSQTDNLKSRAVASILDLICEGPIQGLANGAKSIFLNKTQLEAETGKYNFSSDFNSRFGNLNFNRVNWDFREGTPYQPYIAGFGDGVENEIQVNIKVTKNNGPITRTITTPNLNAVRVRLSVPSLQTQRSDGTVIGSEVEFIISVRTGTGYFIDKVQNAISGKTSTPYEEEYRIPLDGNPPWDVRVIRLSDDSTSDRVANDIFWASYVEIIDEKLTYPNSAIVAIKFDARQFSSIPERLYEIKGLYVQIPNNASVRDDGSLTYAGLWNGQFQIAWCANPAWIFYDLITNARYGCGVPSAQINKWRLYEIGQYCDEIVPDGYGGTEPRFLINAYIQERQSAYEMISALSSAFRAMIYWEAGTISAVQDKPGTPVRAFNQTNVKGGTFTYAGTAKRSRHNVAIVRWSDPQVLYESKLEIVEDAEGISKYGANEISVIAFGCTSRGQAHRLGRWMLYTERLETETITFSVGAEGIPVRPGDLIKIGDAKRAGIRNYGRIQFATTINIQLDSSVELVPGLPYNLGVMLPNGTFEEQPVANASNGGQRSSITLLSPFSTAPEPESIWLLSNPALEKLYRVIGVSEGNNDGATEYEITAIAHDPTKYAAVEEEISFENLPVPRRVNDITSPPSNVSGKAEIATQSDGSSATRLVAYWQFPLYQGKRDTLVNGYIVQYRQEQTGNWVGTSQTISQNFEWSGLQEGTYYVRARAISISGNLSDWAESSAIDIVINFLRMNSGESLALDSADLLQL